MKKRKLFLKIGAGLLAFGLIIFCFSLTFSFTGNPLIMLIARGTAQKYIRDNYPEYRLEITDIHYDFKFAEYAVSAQSPESQDTRFGIFITKDGANIAYDTFQTDVEQRGNTLSRLSNEYTKQIETIVSSIPEAQDIFCYFSWATTPDGTPAIPYQDIPLDMPFSMQAIHSMDGSLMIRITCNTLNTSEAAHLIKTIQTLLAAENMEPAYYNFYFEEADSSQNWLSTATYPAKKLQNISEDELELEIREANKEQIEAKGCLAVDNPSSTIENRN